MLVRPPKKAPACDSCKSKRVLCHPQTNGSCPRCLEKGILCKTTYIPRGRPKKTYSADPPSHISAASSSFTTSSGNLELSKCALLTPELVKHLFKCFAELPQQKHPIFHHFSIEKTLIAASWHHHLLPPQEAVLTACICAAAASVSWHPTILGPGVCPESLKDPSVMFPGADLRSFGERRAPMCRMLVDFALKVAFEGRITLEPTELNAASCLLLDTLEYDVSTSSRPWASAYLSHIRSVALNWSNDDSSSRTFWAGYLMAETLRAALNRRPVLVTNADQLFLCGPPPPPLEALLESIEKQIAQPPSFNFTNTKAALVFNCVFPFLVHSANMARDFYENVAGEYARSQPPSEPAILKLLNNLATMQSLISHCIGDVEFPDAVDIPKDKTAAELRAEVETFPELRSCAFAMSVIFTALTLALYREMEARADAGAETGAGQVAIGSPTTAARTTAAGSHWARTRMTFLRQQAHDMARSALPDVRRLLMLQSHPLCGVAIEWSNVLNWGEFLADEADVSPEGVLAAEVAIFERLLNALKGVGYSYVTPRLNTAIERLEAHLAAYHFKAAGSVPAATEMSMFVDPQGLETPELDASMSASVSEMSFLLDGSFFAVTDSAIGI
ncbi:Zn(2)-C6 fungal-type transcriptional factor [Mycena kentingensis (nom. inval.)]|nr:Zn(2)-C6 fungal-type transcriptional factor [Mycena kentingensis (nom. inval.)]